MERKNDAFRMEAAGSLTPELEGAPRSGVHLHRTKEKGQSRYEARKKETQAVLDHEEKG